MVTAVSKHTAKATTKNKKNEKIIHQGYIGRFWLWCFLFSHTKKFSQNKTKIYLLYISTSGFHNLWGGIRKSLTPPYSDEFHRKFMSFHSFSEVKEKKLKCYHWCLLIGQKQKKFFFRLVIMRVIIPAVIFLLLINTY